MVYICVYFITHITYIEKLMFYTQYHMYSDKFFNIYYNTDFISCVYHLIHFVSIPCGGYTMLSGNLVFLSSEKETMLLGREPPLVSWFEAGFHLQLTLCHFHFMTASNTKMQSFTKKKRVELEEEKRRGLEWGVGMKLDF